MKKKKTVAIDFDGTIVENIFPEIGAIKQNVVDKMREWYEQGHTIIIWTCRTDQYAEEARKFLDDNEIPYHYFNENPTNPLGDWCRKIFADVYLDDRALNVDDLDSFNLDTLEFENDEVLEDIKTLLCKVYELSLHKVNPELEEVKQIAKKYGLEE